MGLDFGRALGARLRAISRELHGDDGTRVMADLMGIPARSLENYERGISPPAEFILDFIAATGADPEWLRTGRGEMFSGRRRRGLDATESGN